MENFEIQKSSSDEIAPNRAKPNIEDDIFKNDKWWNKKLFRPRDIEGEPVKEQIKFLRELYDRLSKNDARLIAITVLGSTLKGYSVSKGNRKSDIDIAVITEPNEVGEVLDFNQIVGELNKIMEESVLSAPNVSIIERIDTKLEGIEPIKIKNHTISCSRVANIFLPGIGELEKVRKTIIGEVNTYEPKKRERWLMDLIHILVSFQSEDKPVERGVISQEEIPGFLEKKEQLMEERIRRMFS